MGCKSIGRLVSILHRQAQIYLHTALKDLDIGSSEHAFLITLLKEGRMTQEELSARILIDKAATARAVKSLEDKGYVRREADPEDKRAKMVICTEKAVACRDEIQEALRIWADFLMADLDAQTAELVFNALEHMSEKARSADFKELITKEKTIGSFKTTG